MSMNDEGPVTASLLNDSGSFNAPVIQTDLSADDIKKEKINPDDMKRDGLTQMNVAAYSVGHFFNDLCAVMWFMYLAWYLKEVVGLTAEVTAASGLAGQIADGLATTLVGSLSDKINTPCGKRMPWFIFGTLLVFPSFMGIYIYPEFVINGFTESQKTLWYICLPAIFNVGWASA